jgi:hypothetical protein
MRSRAAMSDGSGIGGFEGQEGVVVTTHRPRTVPGGANNHYRQSARGIVSHDVPSIGRQTFGVHIL